jgi:hypothetical protein
VTAQNRRKLWSADGLVEIAPPVHDLAGIADVIERRDLTTGKLPAILMSQHLQLELRTVRAALGAQTIDTVHAIVTHPSADLLLGNLPPPSQELRAALARQEALDYFQLELSCVPFMKSLEVCPTSGRQFKPGAIHRASAAMAHTQSQASSSSLSISTKCPGLLL